jgi:hypothetical protein
MKYKQQHMNSCGATTLMCVAAELGVTRFPQLAVGDATEASAWKEGGDFVVSPRTENALYWYLSDTTLRSYSMPDRLVHCARLLGLHPTIHKRRTVSTIALDALYKKVLARCRNMDIRIEPTAPGPLATNQRELVVVHVFGIGLHYVMHRPDDSYMDPADGQDYASFAAMNTWTKCYHPTGLSMVVTGNEVSGEDLQRLFGEAD